MHDEIGSNYRLSEIQSAIGRIQLKKLENWNKIRSFNAEILQLKLQNLSTVRLPIIDKNIRHAWYKFYAYLRNDSLADGWSRDRIIFELNQNKIPVFSGSCSEIYLEDCMKKYSDQEFKTLKNAKILGDTSLMFLVHPTIDNLALDFYISEIENILKKSQRSN